MVDFPAIKFASASDQSRLFPTPVRCVRVEKPLESGWRTWANWSKIMQILEGGL